jgi:hypothetical protein
LKEKRHPANYRGCRHAKEEMIKKKRPKETPKNKTTTSEGQMYLPLQLFESRLNKISNRRKSQAVPRPRSSNARNPITQFRLPLSTMSLKATRQKD